MRQDNLAMLQDTLSIFEQGFYQLDEKTISLKLSRKQQEMVEDAGIFSSGGLAF